MKEHLETYFRTGLPTGTVFSVEEVALFSGLTVYGKVSWDGGECEKKAQEWFSTDLAKWAKDNLPTPMPATASGPSNPTPDFGEMDRWIASTGQELSAPLSVVSLADTFYLVEVHNIKVTTVYVNATLYQRMKKLSGVVRKMQVSYLHRGCMAALWGAEVIVSRNVPDNTVYGCANWGYAPHLNPNGFSKLVVTP